MRGALGRRKLWLGAVARLAGLLGKLSLLGHPGCFSRQVVVRVWVPAKVADDGGQNDVPRANISCLLLCEELGEQWARPDAVFRGLLWVELRC